MLWGAMLVGRHLMIQLWYVQDPTNIQDQRGTHLPTWFHPAFGVLRADRWYAERDNGENRKDPRYSIMHQESLGSADWPLAKATYSQIIYHFLFDS